MDDTCFGETLGMLLAVRGGINKKCTYQQLQAPKKGKRPHPEEKRYGVNPHPKTLPIGLAFSMGLRRGGL
jgi:hypothetical protein